MSDVFTKKSTVIFWIMLLFFNFYYTYLGLYEQIKGRIYHVVGIGFYTADVHNFYEYFLL